LVILGVAGLVLLAWKRPETVSGLAARPQLARVPASMRATPMRFAGTVGFASFVLIGLTLPLGATRANDESPIESPVARATAAETSSPTAEPTERPTASPTVRATPRPTPVATPVPGSQPTGPTEVGTVVNVVDGDTIDVVVDGVEMRVRYIGMDTPEVHSGFEWLGAEASAANSALVAGKEVILEKDVSEVDQFDRALRYVWLRDGAAWTLVNLELIRLGFASITTYPPDVKYTDSLYVDAQDAAQAAGVGLWGAPPTPQPTPVPTPPPAAPVPFAPPPAPAGNCDPSYPNNCIPVGVADLNCGDIAWRGFVVLWNVPNPDPHGFDRDADGIGCES
jgi:micrococcal nuclease